MRPGPSPGPADPPTTQEIAGHHPWAASLRHARARSTRCHASPSGEVCPSGMRHARPCFSFQGAVNLCAVRCADAAVSPIAISVVPAVCLPWSESITGFPRFLGPLPTPAPAVGRVPMHLPPDWTDPWPFFHVSREDSSLTHANAIVSIVLPAKTNLATCWVFSSSLVIENYTLG